MRNRARGLQPPEADTPAHMRLLTACLGPQACQRRYPQHTFTGSSPSSPTSPRTTASSAGVPLGLQAKPAGSLLPGYDQPAISYGFVETYDKLLLDTPRLTRIITCRKKCAQLSSGPPGAFRCCTAQAVLPAQPALGSAHPCGPGKYRRFGYRNGGRQYLSSGYTFNTNLLEEPHRGIFSDLLTFRNRWHDWRAGSVARFAHSRNFLPAAGSEPSSPPGSVSELGEGASPPKPAGFNLSLIVSGLCLLVACPFR